MSEATNLQEPESTVRALSINEVEEDEGNREVTLNYCYCLVISEL